MTAKELRKLGKKDILELLLEQTKRADRLEEELNEAKKRLEDRSLKMEQIGSIAEASLAMNDIFVVAQKAADEYVDNVKSRMEDTDSACKAMIDAATLEAEKIVSDAKAESEQYWMDVKEKLDAYYEAHQGLKELLGIMK